MIIGTKRLAPPVAATTDRSKSCVRFRPLSISAKRSKGHYIPYRRERNLSSLLSKTISSFGIGVLVEDGSSCFQYGSFCPQDRRRTTFA